MMALLNGRTRLAKGAGPARRAERLALRASQAPAAAAPAAPAPAAAAAAPAPAAKQRHRQPQSASAIRGTWAYRLLDRVSLVARRLEEVEAEKQKQQQKQQQQRDGGGGAGGRQADAGGGAAGIEARAAENDVGALLDRIFEDDLEPIFMSRGGYRIPPRERRELDASGGSATYGEVLPNGVRAIARRALALDAAAALASSSAAAAAGGSGAGGGGGEDAPEQQRPPPPPPPVFVDLGSGTGRAVMQVAGEFPGVARAVGIELGATRVEQAEAALELLLRRASGGGGARRRAGAGAGGGEGEKGRDDDDVGGDDGAATATAATTTSSPDPPAQPPPPPLAVAPVEFLLDDLATCDLAATGGTHFYACTTAFSAALCRSLAERLCHECPSFRVLATTRALPAQPHLRLVGRVDGVEYSWTGRGSAYVYARSAEDAPPEVLARLWGPPPEGLALGGRVGGGQGAVALPSVSPLAMSAGLVAEEPMLAAMEAAAVTRDDD